MRTSQDIPGIFITFEGDDGAGKSTHIRFLADVLRARGLEVVQVREPGGTSIGEQLRAIVLDPHNAEMVSATELLIYEAARAQIVAEVILPALRRGAVVLCDRFIDSTIAYQGYGRGLDIDFIEAVNDFACQGIRPDLTIFVTCDSRAEKSSRADRREESDRLEQAGDTFHSKVVAGFDRLASSDPDRIVTIDTSDIHSATAKKIFTVLAPFFPWLTDGSVDLSVMLADFDAAHKH